MTDPTEPAPVDEATRRLRRARLWRVAFAGLVILLTVGVFVAISSGAVDNPIRQDDPAAWQEVLSLVVTLVALVLMVIGLVRMVRSGAFRTATQKQMYALSRRERRQAYRWVRRAEPVPEASLGKAAAVAGAFHRQGRALPLYVGIGLNALGQLLRTTSPWLAGLLGVAAVGIFAGLAQVIRDARRADRWLAAHPGPVF